MFINVLWNIVIDKPDSSHLQRCSGCQQLVGIYKSKKVLIKVNIFMKIWISQRTIVVLFLSLMKVHYPIFIGFYFYKSLQSVK